MSLQLILGSSGAGKSYTMYNEMITKSVKEPQTTFIAIVPEQFTMQTQKDIVIMHPNHGVMNIDIVSFARLAYRIFEEVGENTLEILDDTGKSLVLRKIIEEIKQELGAFKNKIKMPGFVAEMKSMVSEILQYGISEKNFDYILEITEKKPALHTKMKDIKLMVSAFKKYLEDRYITTEEILSILCKHIGNSTIIQNSEITIDGFTGFTPIQYKVLGLLMKYAKKVTIAITFPANHFTIDQVKEHHLFYLSKVTINRLNDIAGEQNVPVLDSIYVDGEVPYRFQHNKTLAYLEKNLFHYHKDRGFSEKEQNIAIHITTNPYTEAEFVAREIFQLVREKNYQYRDIAVVTGDMESYYRAFQDVLGQNDIPYFIDYKRTLTTNPFIESIRAVLEIIENRFSYESVFRYLRSGMSELSNEEIDLLENTVLARGIKGITAWKKEWMNAEESVIAIKNAVIVPILELNEELKNKKNNVKDYTIGLYQFIVRQNMLGKLETYRQNFVANKMYAMAKEYEQVYKLVMDLFDKIVSLLGDEKLTFKEYQGILEAGFEEIKVGIIPPTIDQVVIGDIERTRLTHIKALFFVGVNEGIIPKSNSGNGILSESEREFLNEAKIELSPTMRENAFIQKFYLYLTLTKPDEQLILSFSKSSSQGKSLRPSYLIHTIMKMFPEISIIDEEEENCNPKQIISRYSGLKLLANEIREYRNKEMNPVAKDLYAIYFEDEVLKDSLKRLLDASFYKNESGTLEKAIASALYGNRETSSVSRLEKYASCAYNHFLNYGLALTPRKEYAVEAVDLGNLYHKSIELFSKRLQKSSFTFRTMTEEFRENLVHECVEEIAKEYGNTVLHSSARNAYIIKRIERITTRTIWALSEHIKRGKFEPEYYELAFPNGRIDRVDLYEDDSNIYVKIIDYKSGNKVFNIVDTYYHLQMQLIIYMGAVLEIEKRKHPDKKVIPAAICYYHIQDPIINKGEDLISHFQMSGLFNTADNVIDAIESDLEGKSIVIPVSKKNGKLGKNTNLVTEEEFHLLIDHVQNCVKDLNFEILEGNIEINPYEKKSVTSCDYCPYGAVCGFDLKLSETHYRKVDELKPEEVWEKIKGEECEK